MSYVRIHNIMSRRQKHETEICIQRAIREPKAVSRLGIMYTLLIITRARDF